MIMRLKQWDIKIKPRIKRNHNKYNTKTSIAVQISLPTSKTGMI